MGLPMFREPALEATKPIGKKGDPTAPARSSIRRQRSVRYPTHTHRDRQSSRYSQSHHYDRPPGDALRVRDRARVLSSRSTAARALNVEIAADQAHAEASRQRRLESGRAILRDALSYEHTHQPITMGTDSPYPSTLIRPPTPSSTSFRHSSHPSRHRPVVPDIDRQASLARARAELNRSPPPAYIPSPPYSDSNDSSPNIPQSAHTTASLTPRFAPAHVSARLEVPEQLRIQHQQPSHEDAAASDPMLDDLPPLHRVNRRHTRERGPSVNGELDGLGDRWRSVSPDTDPWEILLSTMPPDERLPSTSASSSFRSNEDLAPYEESGGLAQSTGSGMSSYPVICDNTESDFTETEDDTMVDIPRLADSSRARMHGRHGEIPSASSLSSRRVRHTFRPQTSESRSQRYLDEMAWLTSNDGTRSGRPSRERL